MNEPAAAPKLSSTILLLRDNPRLEVLMVKRHYEIDFAAGALVFPGGKTNEEDASEAWIELSDGDFHGPELAARVGAVREAFEESGILLARKIGERGPGKPLVDAKLAASLEAHRGPVDRQEESFVELARKNGFVLALDTLVYFGHWITPTMMPKRFDTHFYLAPTPPEQLATHDGRETTEAVWLEPQEALDMAEDGRATVIFPTRMNLGKLGECAQVAAAVSRFATESVVTVLPVVGKDEMGNPCLHIPAEAGYMQTTEPIERVANVAKR